MELARERALAFGAGALVALGPEVAAVPAAAALRAAALRGLARCGRVRGRFERTPSLSAGSLFLGGLMCTSLLNVTL